MINQSQAAPIRPNDAEVTQAEVGLPAQDLDQEQQQRAGVYSLVARLLRSAPDRALLCQLSELKSLEQDGTPLGLAMNMLGLSASTSDPAPVDDEYHNLFIGIGRGELVPYGSWYQTGFLMEKPLGHLRNDLAALGFERDESVREPEDHVAALCEVMAMLITEGANLKTQTDFFNTHMGDWIGRFFEDLSEADSAVFYKSVGRFGYAFTEFEKTYLSMTV